MAGLAALAELCFVPSEHDLTIRPLFSFESGDFLATTGNYQQVMAITRMCMLRRAKMTSGSQAAGFSGRWPSYQTASSPAFLPVATGYASR
jgi:hypothetical protein